MKFPITIILMVISLLLLFITVGLKVLVMLLPFIVKYVLPVVAVYVLLRYIRNRRLAYRSTNNDTPQTIDLCPHCGSLLTKGHRCRHS
ncbi:MAG: hypothetical protein OYH77_06275 [Pseudomonadota bacterium]|nr:hypothetical protein [Pseudomonadota bacterium]